MTIRSWRCSHYLFGCCWKLPYWVGALVIVCLARDAGAQLRFAWPKANVDLSRYTTVEQCLAGTQRIRTTFVRDAYRDVDMDTMPLVYHNRVPDEPEPVVTFARACANRFSVHTFAMTDGWSVLMRLYAQANRMDLIDQLIARRLTAFDTTDLKQRSAVLDTVILVYQTVSPARLRIADSLLEIRQKLPGYTSANVYAYMLNYRQMESARLIGDTVLAHRAAERIPRLDEALTSDARQTPEYKKTVQGIMYKALTYLTYSDALDSLRRGTGAFVALRKAHWQRAGGSSTSRPEFAVGVTASPIATDFVWEPRSGNTIHQSDKPDKTIRPRPGRVGLVVFYGHECYIGEGVGYSFGFLGLQCQRSFAALRRIAKRFPRLDITIVAQTHGYFSYLNPLSPQEESEWLRRWTQEYHRLPGTLAIAKTPFWNLADPDRRRIEEPLPHILDYAFGSKSQEGNRDRVRPATAFLVSVDGIILHADALASHGATFSEQEFTDLLTVLLPDTTWAFGDVASRSRKPSP